MKSKTYNRNDLINQISYKLNMNKDESKIILDCVLDSFLDLFLSNGGNFNSLLIRIVGILATIGTLLIVSASIKLVLEEKEN